MLFNNQALYAFMAIDLTLYSLFGHLKHKKTLIENILKANE